ncbi:hypothetical protein FJZ28_00810 [Candidatus Peregrinibacteria bacterium]|nr:hypothetical protein [Candidatus Peregrinibacteria bacterium]
MAESRNPDIDAAQDLLEEAEAIPNVVTSARALFAIAENILGSPDFGGALNDGRAPSVLRRITDDLEGMLETNDGLPDELAAEIRANIFTIDARLQRIDTAAKKTEILQRNVRDSQGEFTAFQRSA